MRIYLRLLKYLRPYYLKIAVAMACMVLFALSNGAMAYLIGPAMKVLFSGGEAPVRFVPFDLFVVPQGWLMAAIPLAIMVMALIKGFSSYGNSFYMGFVGLRMIADLRGTLYAHILRLPVGYFASSPTGGLISRITNDVGVLQQASTTTLTNAFKQLLTLIVLSGIVISMDWQLAIVAFVAFPLAVYPAIRLGRKMKAASRKGFITLGTMHSLLTEAIGGVRIVKAFGMEGYETGRFGNENERLTKYFIRTVKVRGLSSPIMETLGAVGFAATIWYAAFRISAGTLKPEDFITFFAAVIMMYQPIKALNGVHLNIQQGLAAAVRVFEMLDTATETLNETGKKEVTSFDDSIEFQAVTFSYEEKPVLRGLDLKIKRGEVVAIVGSSGAGKTTLVNLLPRFYDPSGGSITIDALETREMTIRSLRSLIAVISQEVILFNDTVAGNIAYGHIERPAEEIKKAALAANAHGFISRMSHGYETVIGEKGVKLSGGERQRLSIARAILKDAPILIMDEATSSLDTESEFEVQKGIENLMTGRTALVIAHRLSTVQHADKIIVLSEGVIVESGRHEELLSSGGEYSRLYQMQFLGMKKGIA